MNAKDFVHNRRGRNSYVIIKGIVGAEIFPNEGANTSSKAWTNAKKYILGQSEIETYTKKAFKSITP